MKRKHTLAAGIVLALSLGVAGVSADPGEKGRDGAHRHGGMHHGMQGGTEHGKHDGMRHGANEGMRHGAKDRRGDGHAHGAKLMTPEERTAFHEKMRNATPEERQKLAQTMRSEMHKRAQERGMTPHEHRGPRGGNPTQAPAAPEHAH